MVKSQKQFLPLLLWIETFPGVAFGNGNYPLLIRKGAIISYKISIKF